MIPSVDAKHPRLFVLIGVGVAGLVLATAVALLPLFGPDRQLWGVRIGFVGFLCLVAGVAGYVSIAIFERHPES